MNCRQTSLSVFQTIAYLGLFLSITVISSSNYAQTSRSGQTMPGSVQLPGSNQTPGTTVQTGVETTSGTSRTTLPAPVRCSSGSDCNDRSNCTHDRCVNGSCVHWPSSRLTDPPTICSGTSNPCQQKVYRCVNNDVRCVLENKPAGTECADADKCDGKELCNDRGACIDSTPIDPADSIACTIDACDRASGNVTHTPDNALCNDSNPCTADSCNVTTGCIQTNVADGTVLSDGRICNGGTPGECRSGDTRPCYSGADQSEAGRGICRSGTQVCLGGSWGTCSGSITPQAEVCDTRDNDCDGQTDEGFNLTASCTVEVNGCSQTGTLVCGTDGIAVCQPPTTLVTKNQCGVCNGPNLPNFNQSCTANNASGCSEGGTYICNADGTDLVCKPSNTLRQNSCGVCTLNGVDPKGLGQPCFSDGDASCRGQGEMACDPQNPSGPLVCNAENRPDGTKCVDINVCDGEETCQAGRCTDGAPLVCNDNDACTTNSCGKNGCQYTAIDYDDDDICTTDSCIPASGEQHLPIDPRACYSGVTGTENVGLCHGGTQTCQNNAWGACENQVTPVAETCGNNTDDNCNGQVNEGCCGNGIAEAGEACDEGSANGTQGHCTANCTIPTCDDGNVCNGAETYSHANGCSSGIPIPRPVINQCQTVSNQCDPTLGRWVVTDIPAPEPNACQQPGTAQCNPNDGSWSFQDNQEIGQSCNEGLPECRTGTKQCVNSDLLCVASGNVQDGTVLSDGRICNGGTPGECLSGQARSCYSGADQTEAGRGICRSGTQICLGGSWGNCSGSITPQTEVCDGQDNDCDSQTDEGFDNLNQVCYAGDGACRAEGHFRCSSDKTTTTCDAIANTSLSTTEDCDGQDDDCDGQIDEGLTTRNCTTNQPGLCAQGTQSCSNGAWATCASVTQATTETCNNADDDCDGVIDNNVTQACYDGRAEEVGTGLCRQGTKRCSNGLWGACQNQIIPVAETCNQADDNCNGQVDEGNVCCGNGVAEAGEACDEGLANGTQGHCTANCTIPTCDDRNACNGVETYSHANGCSVGIPIPRPIINQCQTVSNQCDPTLGRWVVTDIPAPQPNACQQPGTAQCNPNDGSWSFQDNQEIGQSCNEGLPECRTGTKQCVNSDLLCVASGNVQDGTVLSDGRICNGGTPGECLSGQTRPCYSGADQSEAGRGICRSGTQVCLGGSWGTCGGSITPQTEICDAQDNDCDGQTDEGFNLTASCTVEVNGCSQTGTLVCGTDGRAVCQPPTTLVTKNQCGVCNGPNLPNFNQSCTANNASGCSEGGIYICNGDGTDLVCKPSNTLRQNSCGVCTLNGVDPKGLGQPCFSDGDASCRSQGEMACDSQNPSGPLVCNAENRPDGTKCVDINVCDGEETCQAGHCTDGAPLVCNDNDACTTNSCGKNGCQYTAIDYDDDDICTTDSCIPASGEQHLPIDPRACYSGVTGTENVGLCHGGTQTCRNNAWGACENQVTPVAETCGNNTDDNCNGQVNEGCCGNGIAEAGEACDEGLANGTQGHCTASCTIPTCDDRNACNGVETYSHANGCTDGIPIPRPVINQCQTVSNQCDPTLGRWVVTDTPAPQPNACQKAGTAQCRPNDGSWSFQDADEIGQACTDGLSDCRTGTNQCVNNAIQCVPSGNAQDGSACTNDDLFCNGREICSNGQCVHQDAPVVSDRNICTEDSCDEENNVVKNDPIPNCCERREDCNDGNVCNGTELCTANRCQPGLALDCADTNDCTSDRCDESNGCEHNNVADGTALADGRICNGGTPGECLSGQARPCYSGQDQTEAGRGICRSGTQICLGGSWGSCSGEVRPLAQETCGNSADDNCDGQTDEGCCGNGIAETGEACDEGSANGTQGHCSATCSTPVCDDNNVCNGEERYRAGQGCVLGRDLEQPRHSRCQRVSETCDPLDGWTIEDLDPPSANACEKEGSAQCNPHTGEWSFDPADELGDACETNIGQCALSGKKACLEGEAIYCNPNPGELTDNNNNGVPDRCDPSCGNSVIETDEDCDDGNRNESDACNSGCRFSSCGDGIPQSPNGFGVAETCDDGVLNGRPKKCNITCTGRTIAVCGNRELEEGEDCEAGVSELEDNEICDERCHVKEKIPECGNRIVERGEQCEVGVAEETAETCVGCRKHVAIRRPECGNGIIEGNAEEVEECDDGNRRDEDGCSSLCRIEDAEPPEPELLCGNGRTDPGEECDEGTENNNDDVVGACKTDCSGLVISVRREVLPGEACSSEIFDLPLTVTVWSPYQKVIAATTLHPKDFEKQYLVFSGYTGDNTGLGYKASTALSALGDFTFDTCNLPGEPWVFLATAALDSEETNDLVGVSRDNRYWDLLNADRIFQTRGEECLLEPSSLVSAEALGNERSWRSAEDEIRGQVLHVRSLKVISNLIIGAVEVEVAEGPARGRYLGLDLFRHNAGVFDHRYIPVKNWDLETAIQKVVVESSASNLAVVVTTSAGTEWIDCYEGTTGWQCSDAIPLQEAPLVIVEENDIREHQPNLGRSEEARGHVLLTIAGEVVEVEEVEVEEEPDVDEDEGMDDDEEDRRGRGGRGRRVGHTSQSAGRVVREEIPDEDFNPQGEQAQAFSHRFEPEAQNIIVTEEAALRAYRIVYNEAGVPVIEVLPNEVLCADSTLTNIQSNETVAFIHPQHPMPILRNNFGGDDAVAFFDTIDVASGERQGTVVTILHHHNVPPEIDLEPEEESGSRVRIRLSPTDVMNDLLHCEATLKDAQGNDITSHITHADCETLEIDLTGLMEGDIIASDVTKASKSHDGGNRQAGPLSGTVTTTDGGGLSASRDFAINLAGGVTLGTPQIRGETIPGPMAEAETRPGMRVSGGGLCGSIAQSQVHFTSGGGMAYLCFALLTSLLINLRKKLRGGRGSNPRPRA